jgi:hypothetical protein
MKEIENKITWNLNCVIKTRLHQNPRKINLVHNESKINHTLIRIQKGKLNRRIKLFCLESLDETLHDNI